MTLWWVWYNLRFLMGKKLLLSFFLLFFFPTFVAIYKTICDQKDKYNKYLKYSVHYLKKRLNTQSIYKTYVLDILYSTTVSFEVF